MGSAFATIPSFHSLSVPTLPTLIPRWVNTWRTKQNEVKMITRKNLLARGQMKGTSLDNAKMDAARYGMGELAIAVKKALKFLEEPNHGVCDMDCIANTLRHNLTEKSIYLNDKNLEYSEPIEIMHVFPMMEEDFEMFKKYGLEQYLCEFFVYRIGGYSYWGLSDGHAMFSEEKVKEVNDMVLKSGHLNPSTEFIGTCE